MSNTYKNIDEKYNLNRNINDIFNKFDFNNNQIKISESPLNQSIFPLVIYYANDSAFYQYNPKNDSLQNIIDEDVRDMINSCCSWITIEDIIIIALNQSEYSPDWTQQYDSDMPCFNIDFNSSPINIPINILCDFNETLLKTTLRFQEIEPLLLVQINEENMDECTFYEEDITSIKILSLLKKYYFTTYAEFIAYVIFFITTFHIMTPLLMAELFYCCVVINTNTNPATNIAYSQYGHVLILEFIVFIAESIMIYWLCKIMDLRMTIPGAIHLSLFANIFSYIAFSSPRYI
jgi:hypothetical protein